MSPKEILKKFIRNKNVVTIFIDSIVKCLSTFLLNKEDLNGNRVSLAIHYAIFVKPPPGFT